MKTDSAITVSETLKAAWLATHGSNHAKRRWPRQFQIRASRDSSRMCLVLAELGQKYENRNEPDSLPSPGAQKPGTVAVIPFCSESRIVGKDKREF